MAPPYPTAKLKCPSMVKRKHVTQRIRVLYKIDRLPYGALYLLVIDFITVLFLGL